MVSWRELCYVWLRWQAEPFLKEVIVDSVLENPLAGNLRFLNGLTETLESRLNRLKSVDTKEILSGDPWGKWGDEEEEGNDKSYDDMQLKLDLRDRVDSLFRFLH